MRRRTRRKEAPGRRPTAGQSPPDNHIWLVAGKVPAFLRADTPLVPGGSMRRLERTVPTWPKPPRPVAADEQ